MTQAERLRLALLPTELDNTSIQLLLEGMNTATEQLKAWRAVYTREQPGIACAPSIKPVRENVEKLNKAFSKLANERGTQEAACNSIIAALESLQKQSPSVFKELDATNDLQLTLCEDIHLTVFERHTQALLLAEPDRRPEKAKMLQTITAAFIANMKQPGKGGARKQARQYIDGLVELIRQFQAVLPAYAVSVDEDSVFFRYARHWLLSQVDPGLDNPARHIRHAIEQRSQSLRVDIKNPL